MKTLGLYTPHPLEPGGGERYLLSVAEVFRGELEVFLITPEQQQRTRVSKLARELDVRVDHVVLIGWKQALARALFDTFVVMGNEALPPVPALGVRNLLICQFPFPAEQIELTRRLTHWRHYDRVVAYSEYAGSHIRQALMKIPAPERPIHVIHPPVSPVRAPSNSDRRKPGAILSVGRFFSDGHSKRQDELIAVFGQIAGAGLSLHLAGTVHSEISGPNSRDMYELCRKLARNLPVTFYPNATRAELGQLYAQSDCYWHGTGLGADRETQAEKFEHFGITVVEAMGSGCIPFVLDHGGPASIVTPGQDGWIYRTPAELAEMTSSFLASADSDRVSKMRAAARQRAQAYGFEVFSRGWKEVVAIGSGAIDRVDG
jgi:O-antigen biosynthesis protein